MPFETILALLMIAVLANFALIAVSPGPVGERVRRTGRRVRRGRRTGLATTADPTGPPTPVLDDVVAGADLRPAALERVIRVGTWVFLFVATSFVVVTDLWGARQGSILLLLGGAAIATFVLHGIAHDRAPGGAILVAEGGVGLALATALVALTGGALSPFFFAFPLIVVGAAIVVTPGVTLALTAAAGGAYLLAILASQSGNLTPLGLATVGVNLTALCLVAYVGMAIGREQRRARQEANRLATVDALTGLRNRAYLFAALEGELERSQRTGRGFCVLMIDLDDLKAINDGYGHLVGDRALRIVADVIRTRIRRIDTGARFGGDEFVILLPETDPTGGWVLAEKVRQGVADAGLAVDGTSVATSVSVGLVASPQDGETVDVLLEHADNAMYSSKRGGRDRVTGVPVMDLDSARATRPAGGSGEPV